MSYEMNKLFRVKTLSTYLQACDICKSSGASICWHFQTTVLGAGLRMQGRAIGHILLFRFNIFGHTKG